jgi:hypothetical protein
LIARILKLPYRQLWSDYDEADIHYLSFRKPQGANDSVLGEDGKIYHYRDKRTSWSDGLEYEQESLRSQVAECT